VSTFAAAETAACCHLVELALREDLGPHASVHHDVTSEQYIPAEAVGRAAFVVRKPGVLAGLPAAELVSTTVDPRLLFEKHLVDGTTVQAGDRVATVAGRMQSILAAERTALNFLQHLSGIATLTRAYVHAIAGLPGKILDTRKTIPGWRLLAKYAVRQGGGHNHRMGLYDGVLLKDNHWKALPAPRALADWFRRSRERSPGLPIEIEVESLEQLEEVLSAQPDIVLLDNMTTDQMRRAVACRNAVAPVVQLEASGGVNLQTVRAIAETGVDRISVGALTHSAPALDIALDYLPT